MEHVFSTKTQTSQSEQSSSSELLTLFNTKPIPDNEVIINLGLFLRRQELSRILFMNDIYRHIIDVNGIIVEFGVRWGQNLALFQALRGMYEPYNYLRKIVGFDSFEGFMSLDEKDGTAENIFERAYSVNKGYESYLQSILDCHEKESPLAHINKHELVKGDATETIDHYLQTNPETIIALAYFDFDIYKPTIKCLRAIKSHLTKGSVVGFDELNTHEFPGETVAFKEVFGLDAYKIRRSPYNPAPSYIIIE
ncbi:dTDP-6-deoxy-L-hexose 3-O-methyltransferase [Candidatus Magnetobacterium bavaricum]|uniref:dTDP-6-deoxy-L-hexose 3-O-methyltransferase n=1 Tax=Candidatus Magnetobacterium bavaricum TaxID=29290 RepID=A0A0F3GHR4_9BACT|nr:dTDP-6-deoxy-L-hexose 3-O-methyltransferase [Candidatus Magnetobacterium bavaricum]